MKVLFVYSSMVVEKVGNVYHENFLGSIIERYSYFGDLTICTALKECSSSKKSVVNLEKVNFVPIYKENSIYIRYFNRKHNKDVIRECVQNHDFIILHSSSVGDLAADYARKYKKPYFVGVMGCKWDGLWNYSLKGKVYAPFAFFEMRKTVRNANYVLYVTQEFLQRRYPTNGYAIGCSDVVINKLCYDSAEKRKKRLLYYTKKDPINLVTIAGLDVKYKGQRYVIEAIARLNNQGWNYHYYLIGGGTGTYLKTLSKELGIEEKIHILGIIKHENIIDTLEKMDIYIQPSFQEGLPRAVVEAMSAGLPAVGSNAGGIPELLEKSEIHKKGNVKEIVNILSRNPASWTSVIDENLLKAEKFLPEYLDKKRNDFFRKIKKDLESK